MKKIYFMALTIATLALALPTDVVAQSKALKKAQKKEFKRKKKEWKKEKLELLESSRSIDVLLLQHYESLNEGGKQELVIVTENCPTVNLCSQKSLADAQNRYATLASTFVKGRIDTEGGLDAVDPKNTAAIRDRFYAAYEGLVRKNVSNVLTKSLAVGRERRNNYYYIAYYLIDEEGARNARKKALDSAKQAMEQTEANIEWGESIGDFVNDGFKTSDSSGN